MIPRHFSRSGTRMTTYRQPIKDAVRKRMLGGAVRLLSTDRSSASIVRLEELRPSVEWFAELVAETRPMDDFREEIERELAEWSRFHQTQIGDRTPDSLKVLYLCGPEPLNDLEVLREVGINSHNVWAVTGSDEDHSKAVAEASRNRIPLKIHQGSLAEFFDQFNESFDIIYVDACGPFCGGKSKTLDPIVNIFQRERLRSPGVLITNFCQPPADGPARERFLDLISAYFAPRYRDLPRFAHRDGPDPVVSAYEPDRLRGFAAGRLDEFYSEFITRFIVDLAMNIIPTWRALSMGALCRNYLPTQAQTRSACDTVEFAFSPGSHPLVAFFRQLEQWQPNDHILNLLAKPKSKQKRKMSELLEVSSVLSRVVGDRSPLLNYKMQEVVRTSWFDYDERGTCDIPLPNLTINSLLGIYGRPWFANTRCCDRVTYQAKTQPMYCDLFALDQCRSFFDWFPVLEAVPSRFQSVPFQIVARCILDRLGRDNFTTDTHPFHGASVKASLWYDFSDRESLSVCEDEI